MCSSVGNIEIHSTKLYSIAYTWSCSMYQYPAIAADRSDMPLSRCSRVKNGSCADIKFDAFVPSERRETLQIPRNLMFKGRKGCKIRTRLAHKYAAWLLIDATRKVVTRAEREQGRFLSTSLKTSARTQCDVNSSSGNKLRFNS
jgi:hypothetical protein